MTETDTIDIPFSADELEEHPPIYLDRSMLERYATCPFQGFAVETGLVTDNSPEADSGTAVHGVIAEAVGRYATDGIPLREYLEQEILMVRPDVQTDACAGLRRSIWAIDKFLTSRAPQDIIAYQGGEGDRSSQLAWELLPATKSRGPVMPTSEIDLLLAGGTKVELRSIDWKTGRRMWNTEDVKASFQFRMHAWLVFHKFPDLQLLHTQVWMTRLNILLPAVTFTRKMTQDFTGILLQAVEYRRQAMENGTEPEAWPSPDKCLLCAAVHECPRATGQAFKLNENPIAFAHDTQVMKFVVDKRLADLRKYVDEREGDLRGEGIGFGLDAPKPPRKPSAKSYQFYDIPDETKPDKPDAEAIKDGLAAEMQKDGKP